jgi:hypothetical protein
MAGQKTWATVVFISRGNEVKFRCLFGAVCSAEIFPKGTLQPREFLSHGMRLPARFFVPRSSTS